MRRNRKSVEVPDDLVAEILSWLPATSLLRFKSVCKHWKSLIEEPEFIALHLQRGEGTTYFLIHRICRKYFSPAPERVSRTNTVSVLADATKFDLTDQLPGSQFHIFHPHNGIFLVEVLHYQEALLHLWNPATKELIALPQSAIKIPGRDIEVVWRRVAGFGFDSKTNDYRVVVIHHRDSNHLVAPSDCVLFAEAYSLRSDSWREIDPGQALQSRTFESITGNWTWNNLHIDGMYFWLLLEDVSLLILSFDFTVQAFNITSLPPDASWNLLQLFVTEPLLHYFFVLNGCIAFVNPPPPERLNYVGRDYEIWVLNEIGNEESWTKLYKFRPCSSLELPLGNLEEDELFVKSECGELEWCPSRDPNRIWSLECSIDGRKYMNIAYVYKESLVQLKRKELDTRTRKYFFE